MLLAQDDASRAILGVSDKTSKSLDLTFPPARARASYYHVQINGPLHTL